MLRGINFYVPAVSGYRVSLIPIAQSALMFFGQFSDPLF